MKVPPLVSNILSFLIGFIEFIGMVVYFYGYSGLDEKAKITSGCTPNGEESEKLECFGIPNRNASWFCSYVWFSFALFDLFLCAFEIGSVVASEVMIRLFPAFASNIVRTSIYFFKGIATLGVANDFGIAVGSIEIIYGGIMLIFLLVNKYVFKETSETDKAPVNPYQTVE